MSPALSVASSSGGRRQREPPEDAEEPPEDAGKASAPLPPFGQRWLRTWRSLIVTLLAPPSPPNNAA
jgi:hypothetical protein